MSGCSRPSGITPSSGSTCTDYLHLLGADQCGAISATFRSEKMDFELAEADVTGLTIANFDLIWCQRYLVAYLALLKEPQGANDPWTRIDLGEEGPDLEALDILARALVTSIVISYARPWSKNRDVTGRPSRLVRTIFKGMSEVENERGSNPEVSPQIEHPAPCIVAASYPLCLSREVARKRAPTGLAVPP